MKDSISKLLDTCRLKIADDSDRNFTCDGVRRTNNIGL